MKETFTREEVANILVAIFLFSGAGNNHPRDIKGSNYGEKAETVITAFESLKEGQSMITAVGKFRPR